MEEPHITVFTPHGPVPRVEHTCLVTHGGCVDGKTASAIVNLVLPGVTSYEAFHGAPPAEGLMSWIKSRTQPSWLLYFDTVPTPGVVAALVDSPVFLVVGDHHASARESLEDLARSYSLSQWIGYGHHRQSGAVLAMYWARLTFPGHPRLQRVPEWALAQIALADTSDEYTGFSAGARSLTVFELTAAFVEGETACRSIEASGTGMIVGWQRHAESFEWSLVSTPAGAAYLVDAQVPFEVVKFLAQRVWSQTAAPDVLFIRQPPIQNSTKVAYSIRTRGSFCLDVVVACKARVDNDNTKVSGGGHASAAGIQVSPEALPSIFETSPEVSKFS